MDPQQLSDREIDILRLVAQAKSNKEIAYLLGISINTVKVHLANIYQKANVSSRTEAALFAIEKGIIKSPAIETNNHDSTSNNSTIEEPETISELAASPQKIPIRLLLLLAVLFVVGSLIVIQYFRKTQITPITQSETSYDLRWQEIGPMPIERSRFATASFGDDFYLIGGLTNNGVTNRVDIFTPRNNLWRLAQAKLTPVKNISAVVLGGLIYIPGGETQAGDLSDKLEVYDPVKNEWVEKSRLPVPISSYALATFEGNLYLFGGRTANGISDLGFAYDPDSDSWEQLPKMPAPRADSTAVEFQNSIYLIGGNDINGPSQTVYSFNPLRIADGELSWKKSTDLPSTYEWAVSQKMGELIFVVLIDKNERIILLQSSGIDTQWISSIQATSRRIGANAGSLVSEGYIYLLGGEEKEVLLDKIIRYQAIYLLSIPMIKK